MAPNVFVFTDEDGDGKADKKEVLFTKTGQPQHDHSTHAFVFGPDGKLYWNFGNEGHAVHDKNGKPVVDRAGNVVNDNGKPYRQGMVFRCDLDGSNFEALGHNFRNNYEVAVDSFGTLWQSDNDDDGNRGVRINYVMEFGNYGYVDEMTGAGWQAPRTNIETEIPLAALASERSGRGAEPVADRPRIADRHLRLRGHAAAGTSSATRSSTAMPGRTSSGLTPSRKTAPATRPRSSICSTAPANDWFRPSDVCVAPDGSLFVADWYDPGVGGHAMGDIDKGRIFRVAPPGAKYVVPKLDVSTVDGAIAALKSPNHEARYLAWTALHKFGVAAEAALAKMFHDDPNPRLRARALWLLSQLPGKGIEYLQAAARGKTRTT